MQKLPKIMICSIVCALCFLPGIAVAGGGEEVAPIVIVANTQGLPVWEAWWGNLYNESRMYFTILTVVSIPIVGLIFGLVADVIMSAIGLDLKSRELAEH
jgi:hypothetical protein